LKVRELNPITSYNIEFVKLKTSYNIEIKLELNSAIGNVVFAMIKTVQTGHTAQLLNNTSTTGECYVLGC